MRYDNYLILLLVVLNSTFSIGQDSRLIKPKNELKHVISSVVQEKTTKSGKQDWVVYSDVSMENTIGRLSAGDSVEVLGWAAWLYFIRSKSTSGYISYKAIRPTVELDSLVTVVEKLSPIEDDAEVKKQLSLERKKHEEMLVKKYGSTTAKKILDGYYWIGMTSEMAVYSLGRPDKVNRTVTSGSVSEQWIYRNSNIYLYFDNGVLDSYQN